MLTVGVESYLDVELADLYVSTQYRSTSAEKKRWNALTTEDKEILLRQACAKIEMLPFGGRKVSTTQTLAFPRLPYQYAQSLEIPADVRAAQVELALCLGDDSAETAKKKRKSLQQSGVTSFSIGGVSESFTDSSGAPNSPMNEIYQYQNVYRLLNRYLSGGRQIL